MQSETDLEIIELSELMDSIRCKVELVDTSSVYFALRRMRLRPIHETTVYLVKICIVLHEMGLPITSAMVCAIKGNSINAAVSTLHTLGDKHIINLVRTGGTNARKTEMLRWNLSETFKGMYYPPITKGG